MPFKFKESEIAGDRTIGYASEGMFQFYSFSLNKTVNEKKLILEYPEDYKKLAFKFSLEDVVSLLEALYPDLCRKGYAIYKDYNISTDNDTPIGVAVRHPDGDVTYTFIENDKTSFKMNVDNLPLREILFTDKENFVLSVENMTGRISPYEDFALVVKLQTNNTEEKYNVSLYKIGSVIINHFIKIHANEVKDIKDSKIKVIGNDNKGRLTFKTLEIPHVELQEENYEPEILAQYKKMSDSIVSKKPFGKLHILNGIPGTGKSYIIRDLCKRYKEAQFIVMKPDMVANISGPSLLTFLSDNVKEDLPIVFIIEDGDLCIEKRDQNNISQISEILNLADGLIGSSLNTRIVITANLKTEAIDKAIFRVGRLGQHIQCGKLSIKRANACLTKLIDKENLTVPAENIFFNENVTLAEVYAKAHAILNGLTEDDNDSKAPGEPGIGYRS